jgi:hypothetical protein
VGPPGAQEAGVGGEEDGDNENAILPLQFDLKLIYY